VLAAGAGGLAAAVGLGSAAGALLALAALGAAVVARARTGGAEVEIRREVDVRVVDEGRPVEVRLAVDAPTGATVEDEAAACLAVDGDPTLAPGETGTTYEVRGRWPRRARLGPAQARVVDPLGLHERRHEVGEADELVVLPAPSAEASLAEARASRLLSGVHKTGQGGLGSDFHALREYRQGDSLRDVNWTATARTGDDKLIVNERERESQARVTVLVDGRAVAGVGTRTANAWVMAGRVATMVADVAENQRDLVRLVRYGPDTGTEHRSAASDPLGLDYLEPLLSDEPHGDVGLREAAGELQHGLEPGEPVILVSNLLAEDHLEEALVTLQAHGARLAAVVPDAPALVARAGEAQALVDAAQARHADRLASLRGADVPVVDWNPDDALAEALEVAEGIRT
jgi:uncharacterized protein (DUF58 family)